MIKKKFSYLEKGYREKTERHLKRLADQLRYQLLPKPELENAKTQTIQHERVKVMLFVSPQYDCFF